MSVKWLNAFLAIFLISFNFSFASSMSNYCAVPPFLSSSVSPNILFVIDVSGSMAWSAYNPNSNKTGWCSSSSGCGWTYTGTEEGYFIPDKVYQLIGNCYSGNYWKCHWEETTENVENPANCPSTWYEVYDNHDMYSGACLNFLLMSRIDLLRWALTGGRPLSCGYSDDPDCDPSLACTGSTCTLETHYNDKVKVPISRIQQAVLPLMTELSTLPRFGALFYSGQIKSPKVYIGDYPYTGKGQVGNADPNHPYTHIKRIINYYPPGGSTGTAPAMWEAYDYFKQSNDHNYSNGFDIKPETYKDPNYFCDYKGQNCKPVPCAKNFVILASDGQWNIPGCSIKNGYESYSSDPVIPAYWLHKKLNRKLQSTGGETFNINIESVYSLGLFLGGTGEQSLKNVAIYGSFDSSKDWPAGTVGSHWDGNGAQYPWDTCYMDDCGNGRGSACTQLPPSSPDWDSNGDGIPDTFFKAQDAVEIKSSLLKFVKNIIRKTASGTSVSVLSEKDKKGALVAQAVFYPQKDFNDYKVDWVGQLFNYWFLNTKKAQNIREDSDGDKKLNIKNDKILEFNIDEYGKLHIDVYSSDSQGKKDKKIKTYESLDDINYLWEAGEILKTTSASSRDIFGVTETGTVEEFSTVNKFQFDDLLGNDPNEFPSCLKDASGNINYDDLINYIRGEDIPDCRSRKIDNTGGTWKLGDIIYSSPRIVYYSDYGVIYTSSNDGILHAFKAGKMNKLTTGDDVAELDNILDLGKEIWGFIPKHVMPYLRYLADPNYCHLYIHDLSPYIITADYNNDGNDEIVLIGGLRLGGGCSCSGSNCIEPPSDTCSDPSSPDCVGLSEYYAIDITDPENPELLWEFTNPDLGFAYSGPAYIKRKNSSGNWKHFVMFASGPTSYDGYTDKNMHIFVLDLETGNLILNKDLGNSFSNSFGGRLFTDGLDVDEDEQTDFVFLGYTRKVGNSTAQGGVIKIWTGSDNPSNWDFDKNLMNFANNPVTSKITVGKCFNTWYLFFGTGRYFYKTDNDQNVNALYGVPFLCDADNNCPTGTINPVHSATTDLACEDVADKTKGAWKILLNDNDGVYLRERNISEPSFSDNIAFFSTTQPTGDICGFGGRTRVWAMNCATGESVSSTRCPGYTIGNIVIKYLVQLSGGNIEEFGATSFSNVGGRVSEFRSGVASEQGGIPITPGGALSGEILLWIEK